VIRAKQDLSILCDRSLLRDSFFNSHCRGKAYNPGTIQTFLRSLGHFYDFITSENLEQFDQDKVRQMNVRLTMWKSAYVKDHQIANMKKLERERRTKITPADIGMV